MNPEQIYEELDTKTADLCVKIFNNESKKDLDEFLHMIDTVDYTVPNRVEKYNRCKKLYQDIIFSKTPFSHDIVKQLADKTMEYAPNEEYKKVIELSYLLYVVHNEEMVSQTTLKRARELYVEMSAKTTNQQIDAMI